MGELRSFVDVIFILLEIETIKIGPDEDQTLDEWTLVDGRIFRNFSSLKVLTPHPLLKQSGDGRLD